MQGGEATTMKAQDLLARGYFPKEVPPTFSTERYATVARDLEPNGHRKWWRPVRHTIFRPGGLRRVLAIPHPQSQAALTRVVESSWGLIDAQCAKSRISLTRPVRAQAANDRSVVSVDPSSRMLRRARLQRSARYVVTADVSQFYNSVYTHSLPWALVGKESAKQSLAQHTHIIGDDIDRAIQRGQDGQTLGIPIGPDTSLIAAEIVLSAVDAALQEARVADESNALRFMDDYEMFYRNRSQAEDALLQLEGQLQRFQLNLNPLKTGVHEVPLPLELRWRNQLLRFPFRETVEQSERSDGVRTEDLMVFFSLAYELRREYPTEPVLAYAVRRAATEATGASSWATFVDLALACAVLEPSSVRYLAPALERGHSAGLVTDLEAVASALNDFIADYGALQHGNEVAWALYMLVSLHQPLSSAAESSLAAMADNASCLLLCLARDLGLCPSGADPAIALAAETDPGLAHSEDWLFAYEATRRNWYRYSQIADDPHFKQLLERDIAFFDTASLEAVEPDDWDSIFGFLGTAGVVDVSFYGAL